MLDLLDICRFLVAIPLIVYLSSHVSFWICFILSVVIALVGEDLQDDVAFHLPGVATTAGPLHIVLLAMIHLMPMRMFMFNSVVLNYELNE